MGRLSLHRARIHATAFLLDAASFAVAFSLSWHAERAHGAGFEILGYLGAASAFAYAVLTPIAGVWSDRFGAERVYRTALVAYILSLSIPLASGSLAALFAMSAAGGAILAFFWPPLWHRLSRLAPGPALGPSVGVFNVAWCLGIVAGPIAAARAYDARGFRAAIVAGAAFAVAGLAILGARFPEPSDPPRPDPIPLADPRRARTFLAIGRVANFTGYFVVADLARLFPRFASHYSIPVVTAAELVAVIYAAQAVAFVILRFFRRWHYSLGTLVATQGIAAAALAAMPFVRSTGAVAAIFAVAGATAGLAYYSSIYYSLALRVEEGRLSGLHEAILGMGACLGPLLGGWIGAATRLPYVPFAFPAVVLAGTVAVEVAIFRARHGRNVSVAACSFRESPRPAGR